MDFSWCYIASSKHIFSFVISDLEVKFIISYDLFRPIEGIIFL